MKTPSKLFLTIFLSIYSAGPCFPNTDNDIIDLSNFSGGIPDFKKSQYVKTVILNQSELKHSYLDSDSYSPPSELQTLVSIARYPADFELNLYFTSRQFGQKLPVMSLGKFKRHNNGEYSPYDQPNTRLSQVYQMIPSDLFAPGERSVISIKDLNKDQVHEITTVFNPISTHTKNRQRVFAYYYDMITFGYLLRFEGFNEADELEIKTAQGMVFQTRKPSGIYNCSSNDFGKTKIKDPNNVKDLMCCPSPIDKQAGCLALQTQGTTEIAIFREGEQLASLLLPYGRSILPKPLKSIYDEIKP